MSPKKTIDKDARKAAAEAKKAASDALDLKKKLKLDQANMVTTLKNGTQTPERKQLYEYYKKLSHFDSEKKLLLEKFNGDKSCQWFNGYVEEKSKVSREEDTALIGFGTRSASYYF